MSYLASRQYLAVLPQSQGVFGGSAFFGLVQSLGITTLVLHVYRLASDT